MWAGSRIASLRFRPPPSPWFPLPRFVRGESRSAVSPEDTLLSKKDDLKFLPWLQRKAGQEVSSMLSIGSSAYGRSLFATRLIHVGESILKVPYNVHITPNNMPSELEPLIGAVVGNIARLAVVLLAERRRGQDSEWAPYVSSLPHLDDMHCLIFWSKDELEMVRPSLIYQEALHQRTCIENDFLAVKPAVECFPEIFGDISLEDFMHACALVGSRAWGTSKGLSLVLSSSFCAHRPSIPFADFLNHDGNLEAELVSDEDKKISEVFAGRDYAAGEQVQILMDVPSSDPLHTVKMELVHKHCMQTKENICTLSSNWCSFTIKEVRSIHGKGNGIPQSLRAFVRVLSAKSPEGSTVFPSILHFLLFTINGPYYFGLHALMLIALSYVSELKEMCIEASENDGRLGRRPLRSRKREVEAHHILLSQILSMIRDYNASIELLESPSTTFSGVRQQRQRRQMARHLLTGELRVLESACSWLTNYCSN